MADIKFINWLEIFKRITDELPPKGEIVDNGNIFKYQYICVNETTMIGYLYIWEKTILKGIWLSRVKVPANSNYITTDEQIKKYIPENLEIIPF